MHPNRRKAYSLCTYDSFLFSMFMELMRGERKEQRACMLFVIKAIAGTVNF